MVSPRRTQQANTSHIPSQRTHSQVLIDTKVARDYCFYLDLKSNDTTQTLIKRIEDLGLAREQVLTERVTHVVSDQLPAWTARAAPGAERGRRRADAMLERVCPPPPDCLARQRQHAPHTPRTPHITISVQKAVILLDKIYDSIYKAFFPPINVKVLRGHYIKFEAFDRLTRPVFKEFETWPEIPKEPEFPPPPKIKEAPKPVTVLRQDIIAKTNDRMTKKHRARKEESKESKAGYCEMCNVEYIDAMVHRRSPHHLAFVRDPNNFRSLDALIQAGADVDSFLEKAAPLNGERRSLRNLCNGDADFVKPLRRSHRSHTPDSTPNGTHSPRTNGLLCDSRKPRTTRCRKTSPDAQRASVDRQYYKVIGVSTKLRSSGGFAAPTKDSLPPTCNGTSPGLVVKFRRVRKSELSVLSDEAEQFMFPRRTSTSSSSDEEPEPQSSERRRSARPTALKEESSEEDSSQEDRRKRRKRALPIVKRSRLTSPEAVKVELPEIPVPPTPKLEDPAPRPEVVEEKEKCLKWEDGRLKAAPVVEELQFAFESVPHSEPWYEAFSRQDQDKQISKNVPQYFAMYSTSPKLPYELGQLPPLKPNCCPLSDLVRREDKSAGAGPSRAYGTRGNKKQRIRKRTVAALIALEKNPRKSPREHASTLAMLGGLLHRRKNNDDTKSTASEDTCSDAVSNIKSEPPPISQVREQSERLQQFLSEVFEDAGEYDIPEETMEGEATVATFTAPDVVHLVSECDKCEIIRDEVATRGPGPVRRGYKFKKKNRTGWPNKKKVGARSSSRADSAEDVKAESLAGDANSATEAQDTVDESTHESASEIDESTNALSEEAPSEAKPSRRTSMRSERRGNWTEGEGSAEECGGSTWEAAALQPVVRVARVDPRRTLRSAATAASRPGPRARRARAYRTR